MKQLRNCLREFHFKSVRTALRTRDFWTVALFLRAIWQIPPEKGNQQSVFFDLAKTEGRHTVQYPNISHSPVAFRLREHFPLRLGGRFRYWCVMQFAKKRRELASKSQSTETLDVRFLRTPHFVSSCKFAVAPRLIFRPLASNLRKWLSKYDGHFSSILRLMNEI